MIRMSEEPVLDRPGAGLPAPELWMARILFRNTLRKGSREDFLKRFELERGKIRELIVAIPREERGTRILIPRLRGLEDSSRFWSTWMTLDHLRITNQSFTRVVQALTSGQVPPGKADTAAVKPDPEVGSEIEADYENSCDAFLETVNGVGELHTPLRYEHPWFGPLDAFAWTALAATHMGIHRAQIDRIGKKWRSGSTR